MATPSRATYTAGAGGDAQYQAALARSQAPALPSAPSAVNASIGLSQNSLNPAPLNAPAPQGAPPAPAAPVPPRNLQGEAAYAKSHGGPPTTPQETAQMIQGYYPPDVIAKNPELQSLIAQGVQKPASQIGGMAIPTLPQSGVAPVFDPTALKAQGYSDAQIAQLQASGNQANTMQTQINATPKPTNSSLWVLEQALQAKSPIDDSQTDSLYAQVGIPTSGAGAYAALANNLQQHQAELTQKKNVYNSFITQTGGQMNDAYANTLNGYNRAIDQYNHIHDQMFQQNQKLQDYEYSLNSQKIMADKQADIEQKARQWEESHQKPQFIQETDNQAAGYFDPVSKTFTPLSVGGNSRAPISYGDYQENASSSNGNSLTYSSPQPHGSANVEVTSSNPKLANIYENGFKKNPGSNGLGGQCAYEVEHWTNLPPVGNSLKEKAASLQKFVNQGFAFYKGHGEPQVGYSVISNDDPNHGHVWVINAITDDGKYVASEFNRAGSRVFSNNRVVDPNDKSILGFVKTTVRPDYQVDAKSSPIDLAKYAQTQALKGMDPTSPAAKALGVTLNSLEDSTNVQNIIKFGHDTLQGRANGTLDEQGRTIDAKRQLIRSGQAEPQAITDQRKQLEQEVKKGRIDPAALELFDQDAAFGKEAAKKNTQQQKLQESYLQPMNKNQADSLGFAFSAQQAEKSISDLSNSDKNIAEINNWITRSNDPNAIVSDQLNELKSPAARKIAQAELQWVANVLRGESGAAIAQSEYQNAGATYFPRPGDTQQDLDRKAAARQQKVENLLTTAGPQGAKAWQAKGYQVPDYIAQLYGMETSKPKNPQNTSNLQSQPQPQGQQQSNISVNTPQGAVSFATQAQADAFKKKFNL